MSLDTALFDGHLDGWRVVLASILCWLVTSMSVAAGIGGGGLLVPLYAIVLGLGPKMAVPVSKATIFGVALGNVFLITQRRHPHAPRPLIDYSIAVLMQSGVLLGVVIGVLLNVVLPDIVIVVVLALVLSFNSYKTITKGLSKWAAETRARGQRLSGLPRVAASEGAVQQPRRELLASSGLPREVSSCGALEIDEKRANDDLGNSSCQSPALIQAIRDDGVQFPLWAWGSLLLMCAFLVFYSLLLNGSISADVEPCHFFYWYLYALPVPFYGSLLVVFARRNHVEFLRKQELVFPFARGDIQWTAETARQLPPIAICSGIMSGMLGIGGGMVLGPLFIELGIEPEVSTATTGFMLLFTGFAGTTEYLTLGRLPWRYLLWFGTIGAIGAQMGQRVVKRLIARTGRPSIVVLLLGGVILAAVLCMTAIGIGSVVSSASKGEPILKTHIGELACNRSEAALPYNATLLY